MKKLYRMICNFEEILTAAGLLLTVFIIFTSAFLRTIGKPINGALDIALLLFSWSAFLGADVAFREDKLVNVDVFYTRLPEKMQKPVKLISYIIIDIFLVFLIYYGIILSINTWHRSFQGIPTLSYTWVTISVPISAVLMLVTSSIKVYKEFIKKEKITPINTTNI